MLSKTATTVAPLQNGALVTNRANSSAVASKTATAPIARPYKDFLTPALHRRFTKASAVVLLLCWAEAASMSHAGWFWSWFPLSLTGIRAVVLFVPCLAVFIVRVANLHVGKRATASPFDTFLQDATSMRAVAAFIWYGFSGWFFGEVFIWTRSQDAGLGWVDLGKAYERPRMNENPVVLRALYIFLAIIQSVLHLVRDTDRLPLEARANETVGTSEHGSVTTTAPGLPEIASYAKPILLNRVMPLTLSGVVFIMPTYFFLVRSLLWNSTYWFARIYFRELPVTAEPTGLINFGTLAWQAFSSAFMLVLLWEVSNAAFTILAAEPPLKKEQPLTSEIQDASGAVISRSKNPNGSLIRGLRAKNDVPKSFAFWELYLICTRFGARRKTIFTEVNQSKDSETSWNQILSLCASELSAISSRIQAAQQPAKSKQMADEKALQRQQHENLMPAEQPASLGLPRIAGEEVLQDRAIFAKPTHANDFAHTVGNVAKSFGQSPGAKNPVLPRARRAAKWVADEAISKDIQRSLASPRFSSNTYVLRFLELPLASIFHQTFARRACGVIFGSPHSNRINIIHAARSLAHLTVCSLKEDDYGQVAKTVPVIVRTFTTAIVSIEGFMVTLKPSWTDVQFVEKRDRKVAEVEDLLAVLRDGLEQILLAFAEYASAVGLTKKEVREAREAVGKGGREMVKV